MDYTLWSKGTLLGRATPVFPMQPPHAVMGYFHPAETWETAGAPLAAWAREYKTISKNVAEVLKSPAFAGLEEPERSRRMQQALIDDPDHHRMRELKAAIDALELELRDERGRVVLHSGILIMPSLFDYPDDQTRDAMAGLGIEQSDLMLVASAGVPATGGSGGPAIPPSSDR